uniref:Selectin P n=1 Tax=Cyprinus carpio TaxID=7962 RepID=A0A8C1UB94_CYPCA
DDPLGKFSFRSSCITTCEEGYTLRGETTITCLSDGNWSAPSPVCEVIRCDALESGQHGSLHCQDPLGKFSYGSLCWLECGAGFTLNGSNFTSCISQGKWSHEFPVCQAVACDPLETPAKSHLTCADPLGKFSLRSSCNITCEEGYTLRGETTLTCLSDGNWSAPSPVCEARQCSPLIKPSHGTVTCTHPNGQFSFGTVCEVSCQAGFKLHGTPQMECLEMGKWTDTPPFCLAQQCPHLTVPVNGWVNCSHPHSLFSYGSQCFLGCETGFEITGEPGMECSASGNWSQEMPSCAAVRCEPLSLSHLPELGPPPSMNCSHPHGNFSFGSQCMFQCDESQELSGTSQLTCTSMGAGMLMYAAVGAASSAGLLLFGGLMFLLMRQFFKKSKKLNDSVSHLAQPFLNH